MGCDISFRREKGEESEFEPQQSSNIKSCKVPRGREIFRNQDDPRNRSIFDVCLKTNAQATSADTAVGFTFSNEDEVDLSHFMISDGIIGIGGFGMVQTAKKTTSLDKGKAYALKSLSKALALSRHSGPQTVLTELRSLILLKSSPFICNIHYAFQDEYYLYMILDLAKGGDMRYNLRSISSKRFTEPVVKFYFCQIALALEHCHRHSILHRDIKPENIVMIETGYVKLTDFGVAKILDDIENCRSTSGTHGYMAPEVYHPQHRHGIAADWFSLGVTLYELLIGKRPFETARMLAFRDNPDNQDTLKLTMLSKYFHISDNCKEFLQSILKVKPSERLGGDRDIEDVKEHSWFKGYDWESLMRNSLPAPFKPDIHRQRDDINESEFVGVIKKHFQPQKISPDDQKLFSQYEFNNHLRISFDGHETKDGFENLAESSKDLMAGSGPGSSDYDDNCGYRKNYSSRKFASASVESLDYQSLTARTKLPYQYAQNIYGSKVDPGQTDNEESFVANTSNIYNNKTVVDINKMKESAKSNSNKIKSKSRVEENYMTHGHKSGTVFTSFPIFSRPVSKCDE